jgi:RNA polymerase sigma-70 factor (ECF subfamily)
MALRADDVDLGRDRSLVEQFQAGDSTAFDDLYRRYFQRLYRFCLKRVGDSHEAEELAQEAFTRAYLNLDNLGGDRRFYPWVTVIAGRLCVDTHRRRARSQPCDDVDPGVVDGGQEAVLNQADVIVLNQAISRLASRHQEVLDLRERRGYSYQRISEYYGVSLGTVEALLWRARKALRREYLALTNGETPALAGAPLGIGFARLATWRLRISQWVNGRGQPWLAGAAAIVTATTVGLGASGANVADAATAPIRAASAAHVEPASAPLSPAVAAVSPTVTQAVGAASTGTAAAVHTITAAQQYASELARMPVEAGAGAVGLGLDPNKLVPTLTANLHQSVQAALATLLPGGSK